MNRKILHEPYPLDNSYKRAIVSAVLFGLFIALFLLFFQPFGLTSYKSDTKTLEIAAYGLVTTFCLLFNFFLFSTLFKKWFSNTCWTVGKNIAYTIFNFFIIGLANLLYSVYRNYIDLDFNGFLFYQSLTVVVGAFPVIFSTLLVYNRRMKKMLKEADYLNTSLSPVEKTDATTIRIPSLNKSENISIQAEDLLMVKAVENYIELHSLKNGSPYKEVIRNTLKNVSQTLADVDFIQKCHRSYLVNLNQVAKFSGNAQGLALQFEQDPSIKVPVSRAYVKEIKAKLSH